MVQIILSQFSLEVNICKLYFISHMVQIIQIREMILENAEENFISHMVQIILQYCKLQQSRPILLYIPHGSDNTKISTKSIQ